MLELKACVGMLIMTGMMCSKGGLWRECGTTQWGVQYLQPACHCTVSENSSVVHALKTKAHSRRGGQLTNLQLYANYLTALPRSARRCIHHHHTFASMRQWRAFTQCPFRVYIPSKPDQYGLKIWSMCDVSSSYLCNLQVYLGKEGDTQNSNKEPEMYVIWQLRSTVLAVTLPLTISSRRTHWPSSCQFTGQVHGTKPDTVGHDEANDWLPVAVSQHLTYADRLQGLAGDRCRTSRIDVCGNGQQESEWVSSFLTAHQHIKGHSVP